MCVCVKYNLKGHLVETVNDNVLRSVLVVESNGWIYTIHFETKEELKSFIIKII